MSHSITVLEGPDGVGKTTLALALESWYGPAPVTMVKSGPPPDDEPAALHYWDRLDRIEEAATDSAVVVDRFHVGEMVYGPVLRGAAGMSMDEATVIDMRLMAMGANLVHCFLGWDDMVSRLVARDGGVPDAKSGATVHHSCAIRAGFIGMLGREPGGERSMPGAWEIADMTVYPDQLAGQLGVWANTKSMFRMDRGWLGSASASTVLVLPDKSHWGDMDVMSDLAWHLRALGVHRDVAVVMPTKEMRTQLRGHCSDADNIVCLGVGSEEWIAEHAGLVPRTTISMMVGNPMEWRHALRSAMHNETQRRYHPGSIA